MAYSRLKCLFCEFECKQESRFLDHLTDIHNKSNHLDLYLEQFHNSIHPTCNCKEACDIKLPWMGWKKGFISKYARGHNARVDSVYLDKNKQDLFAKKRKKGFQEGKYKVWNDGLTKETSDKVALMSEKTSKTLRNGYKNGLIVDWRIVDPEKATISANNISKTKQHQIELGTFKTWNKGLTKETNQSLMNISEKLSNSFQNNREMGNRLSSEEVLKLIRPSLNIFDLVSGLNEYRHREEKTFVLRCKEKGHVQYKSLSMLKHTPICFICHPKESKAQLEIFEYVKSLGITDVISNDRTTISPKELDIFSPSRNFGIEYNGLYWHSDKNISDKKYHQKKLNECVKKEIKLLSIYEDEWRDKRPLVEDMIRHRLGLCQNKIDARKLIVTQLKPIHAKKFFNENHLEGYVNSKIIFGLVDNSGKIYAALSLRKPFHNKYKNCLEVGRCCSISGINVRGWLGRLTNIAKIYAKDNGINKLMTYVDARVGSGEGYRMAGWSLVAMSKTPRFWWTNFENRYNRFKYRADKTRNMTQEQIAEEAGVSKIFGCQNSIFELEI